jgi:hypothetical protein
MTTENITMNDSAYGAAQEREQARRVLSILSMIRNRAEYNVSSGKEAVEKFAKDITTDNTAYHFEWAHGVMQSSATANVAKYFLNSLDNNATFWNIRDNLQDKLMHGAKYPSFSTSPTSNLMAQFMTSGVAEWLELIERAVAAIEALGIKNPSTTDEA